MASTLRTRSFTVLCCAVRSAVLQDIVLFESIISDLFPDTQLLEADSQQLSDALSAACWECGLQPHQAFLGKALQLHDTLGFRFGVMLVGPAGECGAERQQCGSASRLADAHTQCLLTDKGTVLLSTACFDHGPHLSEDWLVSMAVGCSLQVAARRLAIAACRWRRPPSCRLPHWPGSPRLLLQQAQLMTTVLLIKVQTAAACALGCKHTY